MRILLAHGFYRAPGGEDRHVQQQAELLAKHHVVALFSQRNEQLSENLHTASKMVHSGRMKLRVSRALERFRPDIVHVHNIYPSLGPAVHLSCAEAGIPLVMTVHNHRMRCPNGLMFTEGSMCRRCEGGLYVSALLHDCFPDRRQSAAYAGALWLHRFVLRLENKVALYVTPSGFMRDRIVRWGIPPERTRAIPNFVHPLATTSQPGRFGVFIGRLSSEKGVDVLLRALAQAGDPPFRIVGDGPTRQDNEALARDLGLRRTEFMGRLQPSKVHEVLEQSRYLVMPSVWEETGGISALEAMAHGRPILVSALGALSELVRDGSGLMARPGDVDDLAEKVGLLVRDDELSVSAGEKAWELCLREYSPAVHLTRLEEAYDWVVSAAGIA